MDLFKSDTYLVVVSCVLISLVQNQFQIKVFLFFCVCVCVCVCVCLSRRKKHILHSGGAVIWMSSSEDTKNTQLSTGCFCSGFT